MLDRLCVKNVALIDEADISFDSGLNVLSGETGSGKSVLLDSINFVLGSKADRTMIRYGEEEAFVKAEFSVNPNSEACKRLEEMDIECDGNIIISRRLNIDGKGSIKINGNTVTLSMLKTVTQHLVDVHGQSEHFFLQSEQNQLKVIDGLCGEQAESIKRSLSELVSEKRKLNAAIKSLGGDEAERARRLDLLDYQIKEIKSAELKAGEYEELKARQNVILNAEKILTALNTVKSIFDDDGGICDGISSVMREIGRIADFGEDYENIYVRAESLNAEASDISEFLSDAMDAISFNENEARQVEERITLINSLKKKYGADESEILRFLEKAENEFSVISDSAELLDKYGREIDVCNGKIYDLCVELSGLRKKAAENFCGKVVEQLKTLNIPNAKFRVNFKEFDKSTADLNSVNGCDDIFFEFSANKGEPFKPLNKVISGGELSRFMLTVKTQFKDLNGISTYVFDEIDAGISGYTAFTVANKFKDIAKVTQILAVSHLPQVCAASDSHFLIYKSERDGKTFTNIKKLSDSEKITEIVRLTGSVESETAYKHAEELIKQFK